MVCNVILNDPSFENQIIVPLSTVQIDGKGGKFAFVANSDMGKAMKKSITTGSLKYNCVVINSGLAAHDLIITEGFQKIGENTTLKIVR